MPRTDFDRLRPFNKLTARICGRAGSGEVAIRRQFCPSEPRSRERTHSSVAEFSFRTQIAAALEFAHVAGIIGLNGSRNSLPRLHLRMSLD
jgi:hypothetical protein